MKLRKKELFLMLRDLKGKHNSYPTINSFAEKVSSELSIPINDSLNALLKIQLKEFKKFMQNDRKTSFNEKIECMENSIIIDSSHYTEETDESDHNLMDINCSNELNESTGSIEMRKTFAKAGDRTKRNRTQQIVDLMKELVDGEDDLTMTQLIGYLLHRTHYASDRSLAELGNQLYNDTYQSNIYKIDEALSIMHTLVLTKEQLRLFKNILKSKNIIFPNTNELLEARKKLRPVITQTQDNKGVCVNYKDLVNQTITAQMDLLDHKFKPNDKIDFILKDGCDGAGSQTVNKSKEMKDAAPNMFVYGIIPLQININGNVVWKNPTPNSPECLRPVYLIREKEDDEELKEYVITSTDAARSSLNAEGMVVVLKNNQAINVGIKIMDTMKDLKLKKSCSRLLGADCIICKSQVPDWSNPSKIKEGFVINRTAKETTQLYQQLVDEDGQIARAGGDFQTREGLTQKPITTSNQHSITVTHSYINGTSWFIKLLARLKREFFVWVEKKTVLGEHIRLGKEEVLQTILEDTGMPLERVSGSNSKGGTSTDGNSGRRFFSEELVESLKKCVPSKYLTDVLRLHLLLSTILRVISSTKLVNFDVLKQYCEEASLIIAEKFPWARINYTLHGVLHHSCELIALNEYHGLGALSEEGLEAANKHIRRYLETHSRKNSSFNQIHDVMCRLLERSHPSVINNRIKLKSLKKKRCLNPKLGALPQYDRIVKDLLLE